MAIGLSIFLIAVGAIIRFAINVSLSSIDFHAIGLIIMVAGAALLLIQMFWMVRTTTPRERRNVTRGEDQNITPPYRDAARDDTGPPYYLGPPLAGRCRGC